MDRQTIIHDSSGDRKYFAILPNILDDSGLSPYAVRLYFRIKRRAGDKGICWENSRNLAEGCGMSRGQVTKAKRELEKSGLITITKKPSKHGYFPGDVITIVDIWQKNTECYSPSQDHGVDRTCPPGEPGPVHLESHKKNPIKKNTKIQDNSRATTYFASRNFEVGCNNESSAPANNDSGMNGDTVTGLREKVAEVIRKDGRTIDWQAVDEAIRMWQKECDLAQEDGVTWKRTNLDAIYERYDLITLRCPEGK